MAKEQKKKAYQLKVALKNSKPATWCRCTIPAGITFSQLSLLLRVITKERGLQAFEFDFYHEKICLFEERRLSSRGIGFFYEFMGAFETFIDGLLDTAEWFSFNCSSGNSYRITVEKRMDDFADAWACVQKYKGEWSVSGEQQTNQILKEQYAVSYGKSDFRTSGQIQEAIEQGNYGLQGAKKAISDTQYHKQSTASIIREFSETFPNTFPCDRKKEILKSDSLKSFLETDRIESLKDYAKELGILRYLSLNKEKLAEKIANYILSPLVMKKRMCTLSDEQIAEFETAIRCDKRFRPREAALEQLIALYELDYIIIYDDNSVAVPDEVIGAYKKINSPEFHRLRKQVVWMQACLEMHAMIYGVAPIEIMHRMYRKRPGFKVEQEEFLRIFQAIPAEVNLCVVDDGKIISKGILRNKLYLQIEGRQRSKEFNIPGYREVMDCMEHKYPSQEAAYQELKQFLIMEVPLEEVEAIAIIRTIWMRISFGYDFHDVMDVMNKRGICFSSERELVKFTNLMMKVNNRTRMLIHRGYMPDELVEKGGLRVGGQMPTIVPMSTMAAPMLGSSKEELEERGFSVDLDFNARDIPRVVLPEGVNGGMETGSRKIYPNDPCPCGSGRKYKKCCGRN